MIVGAEDLQVEIPESLGAIGNISSELGCPPLPQSEDVGVAVSRAPSETVLTEDPILGGQDGNSTWGSGAVRAFPGPVDSSRLSKQQRLSSKRRKTGNVIDDLFMGLG